MYFGGGSGVCLDSLSRAISVQVTGERGKSALARWLALLQMGVCRANVVNQGRGCMMSWIGQVAE